MDSIQKTLIEMLKAHPTAIVDRRILKGILLDYLPQNKKQQNLILNAYDEKIVDILSTSRDAALHALQFISTFSQDYGLTNENATWSVVSWCYMLNLSDVANSIASVISNNHLEQQNTAYSNTAQRNTIGLGIYAAGFDIADGLISLRLNEKIKSGRIRVSIIDGEKKKIIGETIDAITVEVKKGQRIQVELVYANSLNWPDYTFSVIKF